jgi:hypothetical protein
LLFILCLSFIAAFSVPAQQTKTVTNEDLEKFRRQRVEAEREYRENYKRLGLPSPEEIEQQNEQKRRELEELSYQLQTQRLQNEGDIQTRANELRAQIASIEAQINYLRNQINAGGGSYSTQTYSYGGVVVAPFVGGRRSPFKGGQTVIGPYPSLVPTPRMMQNMANMYPNAQGIYNRAIGAPFAVRLGVGRGRIGFGRRGFYRGGYVAPVIVDNGGGYVQNDLGAQLVYLEQQHAGLMAQWRLLEEEARRAGIRLY